MHKKRKMPPGRLFALGFMSVILIGAVLLFLPISHNDGIDISFLDALFTATSATCVTGLVVVDTAETYNLFGRIVILIMIQIGGLGVAALGVGITLVAGRRLGFRERTLIKENWNISSFNGLILLLRRVLLITLCIEAVGAVLSFFVFSRDFPFWSAVGISIFHSISSFNNAGFDLMGGFQSIAPYADSAALNLITAGLIIVAGLGYLVLIEVATKRSFKQFSLQTKAVLTTTVFLLLLGTILLKCTEKEIGWLSAFFHSTSTRTAGFATTDLSAFSNAGLFIMCLLMFVGASPGSTGGGIKTTTLFALLVSVKSSATNSRQQAFRRRISNEVISKAFTVILMAALVVFTCTGLLSFFEPEQEFIHLLFESVSAFATVGLSAGLTPGLCTASRIVLIATMFIGRLGPLTIASLWVYKPESTFSYTEEHLTIG